MRKVKKINGYLVVKFNDRELRKWSDTGLGKYGIIDAELYTGHFDIDRSAMEYHSAETLEEAMDQARSLQSEFDVVDLITTYTIIKETDESTKEKTVEPQVLVSEFETVLTELIDSPHYPDITPMTARHELYGFKVALSYLGILDIDECFVKKTVFEPTETSYVAVRPDEKREPPISEWPIDPGIVERIFSRMDTARGNKTPDKRKAFKEKGVPPNLIKHLQVQRQLWKENQIMLNLLASPVQECSQL